MPRSLTSLVDNVATPFGTMVPTAGTTVVLSDEEFGLVSPSSIGVAWTDNGQTSDSVDLVSTQASNVPAQGALTSSAPAAVTSSAPAAITSSAPSSVTSSQNATTKAATQTGSYVQAEVQTITTLANALKISYNAAQVDVAALRATLLTTQADVVALRATSLATQADVVALRATLFATQADLATTRTKLNAALAALTGAGKAMHV